MIKSEQNIFYKALGATVKRRRLELGITLAYLAQVSGEQYKTVQHIEAGKPCSMHHLMSLSNALNMSMEYLAETISISIDMGDYNGEEKQEKEIKQEEISTLDGLI